MSGAQLKWPNWIGLVVQDLQAQRRFYRETLGLTELGAGDDWVQFDGATGVVSRIPRPRDVRPLRSTPVAELTHAE